MIKRTNFKRITLSLFLAFSFLASVFSYVGLQGTQVAAYNAPEQAALYYCWRCNPQSGG